MKSKKQNKISTAMKTSKSSAITDEHRKQRKKSHAREGENQGGNCVKRNENQGKGNGEKKEKPLTIISSDKAIGQDEEKKTIGKETQSEHNQQMHRDDRSRTPTTIWRRQEQKGRRLHPASTGSMMNQPRQSRHHRHRHRARQKPTAQTVPKMPKSW